MSSFPLVITSNENKAECLVFTYKDGLLSAVAHDLKIIVERFEVKRGEDHLIQAIQATFDATSLRCICAMKSGEESLGTLSERDIKQIHEYMNKEVLASAQYPQISFKSTQVQPKGSDFEVRGDLTLHGKTASLSFMALRKGERYVAEVDLNQPDFGIKPFSAVMGTLKIKPVVKVRISVPV